MSSALVVLGSPNPSSFCHAMAQQVSRVFAEHGVDVRVRDLYAEGFDPVARADEARTDSSGPAVPADWLVAEHRSLLSAADHLVVAHPNWWGKPPAIMAGWLDRVLVPGVAYRLDNRDGVPTPLLKLRSLLVLNTGDTPAERERDVFGDPLDAIWRRCVGAYLHRAVVERVLAGPLGDATDETRTRWLAQVRHAAERLAQPPVGA